MMNERPIPEAALTDANSVEMLRVWIAAKGIHCSLKIGMYRESTKIPEERAWGQILADAAQHVLDALEREFAIDRKECSAALRESFLKEFDKPTTSAKGSFVVRH
jgi:Domain of unknown function (DUF5076)